VFHSMFAAAGQKEGMTAFIDEPEAVFLNR
jgi:hypothetical protein